jgi:hypothetical protein
MFLKLLSYIALKLILDEPFYRLEDAKTKVLVLMVQAFFILTKYKNNFKIIYCK